MKAYGVLKFVSDPELTHVGDTVKSSFKLVYNFKRYDYDNKVIKEPNFLEFECWDSAADFIVTNCRQGDEIYVEATPKQESWEKDGKWRSKTIFRIDSFRIFT